MHVYMLGGDKTSSTIEIKWTKILLSWINKCTVQPKTVKHLNSKVLINTFNKYKNDIENNNDAEDYRRYSDLERYILEFYPNMLLSNYFAPKPLPSASINNCHVVAVAVQNTQGHETPLHKLREALKKQDSFFLINKDAKKFYIMCSVLLYHCCMYSNTGTVEGDICNILKKNEQFIILKFCEILSDLNMSVENVEFAIKAACLLKYRSRSATSSPQRTIKSHKPSKSNKQAVVSSKSSPTLKVTAHKWTRRLKNRSLTVLPNIANTQFDRQQTTKYCVELRDVDPSDFVVRQLHKTSVLRNRSTLDISENVPLPRGVRMASESHQPAGSVAASSRICMPFCACARCKVVRPGCMATGNDTYCDRGSQHKYKNTHVCHFNWQIYIGLVVLVLLVISISVGIPSGEVKQHDEEEKVKAASEDSSAIFIDDSENVTETYQWGCINNLCQKILQPSSVEKYVSISQCTLLCIGPRLWPYPVTQPRFGKEIVYLSTKKINYKFQLVASDTVRRYLSQALKMFVGNLIALEKGKKVRRVGTNVKVTNIQIDVPIDPDPRMRLDTDETYNLKIYLRNEHIMVKIVSPSFCGARHGLETLGQLILLDQSTGYLVTLSEVTISDAPSNKYRGLMIDTARNFIPVPDLLRTIEGMSMAKLNTFHWRISDATSFPMVLTDFPKLYEYGAYDHSMVYTAEDIESVVEKAAIGGIRVLIEVAIPGPVGRAWSWSHEMTCTNTTIDSDLCLRMKMKRSVFDVLQVIYAEIIRLTKVEDIFHLSNSIFSLTKCKDLIENRKGFLKKALHRLKLANKGVMPKLPVVWFTNNLEHEPDSNTWSGLGVQIHKLHDDLKEFKVIHSTRWDLSCEMKNDRCFKYRTWQAMYEWKSWSELETFSNEGGEVILWTDLVDSGNLDYHLWPRTAAVAERLWSDVVAVTSPDIDVYSRLNIHRSRMRLRGIQVQPIWPLWCNHYPVMCNEQINRDRSVM